MGKFLRRFSFSCLHVCFMSIFCFQLSAFANDIIQIRFSTDAALPVITRISDKQVTVSFSEPELKNIFAGYFIQSFTQSYPMVADIPHNLSPALSRVYEFVLSSGGFALMAQLDDYTARYRNASIVNKYLLSSPQTLALPNDYNADAIPCGVDHQPLKHLELIGAPDAWDITTGNASIKIAVLDNGFNKSHEDLSGKIDNPGTPTGFAAHGTMVLGLVAANTNNGIGHSAIGYNCRLFAYETGFRSFPQAILSGAKVINCSWYTSCSYNQNDQDMINVAYDMGIVVVAAAGNGGTCGGPTSYVYPAAYDHVIAVTGVGQYFSREEKDACNGKINHADVHIYRANYDAPLQTLQHNNRVDLAAPAYEVRGLSLSSYWNSSGTSFASPIVAGTCGLLFSLYPNFSPADIEAILKCTAFKLDDIAENAPFAGLLGAGRIDAYKALLKAKQMLENKPADVIWYYYNRRGARVDFDPSSLYQHISSGAITGNTIYVEAFSKVPGVSFDWEFTKSACTIKKSGNPVAFNLSTECSDPSSRLVVHVRNKVSSVCDPNAGISLEESACLDDSRGCWMSCKTPIADSYKMLNQSMIIANFANPDVTLAAKPKRAYLVTPNPFSGTFTIRHYLPPGDLKKIQVTNAAGQLVWQKQFNNNAPKNITVDLSRSANGIYFVKLTYASNTITERIVKRS